MKKIRNILGIFVLLFCLSLTANNYFAQGVEQPQISNMVVEVSDGEVPLQQDMILSVDGVEENIIVRQEDITYVNSSGNVINAQQ